MIAMSAPTVLVIARPTAPHLKVLERLPGDTRIIVSNDPDRLREAAPEADVMLLGDFESPGFLRGVFPHATRLRWLHSISAGVESFLPAIAASPVPLTNGRGMYRVPLGEWAVGAMLFFAYNLRRLIRQQEEGRWERVYHDGLAGRTLGIVGYGEIGTAIAERAKPFGLKIVALRRRPELSSDDPLVDAAYRPEQLHQMLAASDYVALATPLTTETRGMIGAAEFAAMKPSAVIVNVGRGQAIDESALIEALDSGKIRGAALDVFTTEPLPAGHPFYRMKNLLLSPHSADHTPGFKEHALEIFVENFERFRRGEPLRNLVDKHAGY
jgi:phosphoglycerate dehydrogenase-like enzyme